MITVGIIGTGFGAKVHLPGFRRVKNAKVLAIVGNDLSKTLNISREAKLPLVFKSWKELVAHPAISAVSIATPPYLHREMASFAMKMGKHVLCEKPLAVSVSEAKKMVVLAKRYNVVNMIDFEFRYIPQWVRTKKLLERRDIGEVRYINISWITGGKAGTNMPSGWRASEKMSGGVLSEFGSHVIDYVEWFFGPVAKVLADIRKIKTYKHRRLAAHDACDMFLHLKSGVLVNVSLSNVMHGGRGHWIEIYGSEGTLKLVNNDVRDSVYGFELYREISGGDALKKIQMSNVFAKLKKTYPDGRCAAFRVAAREFVNAIEMKKKATPAFEDGFRVQRVIRAARDSSQQGRWVRMK